MYSCLRVLESEKAAAGPVCRFLTLNLLICPPGISVGFNTASGGPRSGPWEDGAGARCDAHGPRQGPEPGDDGSKRAREPDGGRSQAESPGYFRGHSGGEGRADAALCGEDCVDLFFCSIII